MRLAPAAAKAFERLAPAVRDGVRAALLDRALEVAEPGRVSGKAVKTIQGTDDTFHRLRVGDHRVMYDVIDHDRTLLVLGIVDRRDLERWLRNR